MANERANPNGKLKAGEFQNLFLVLANQFPARYWMHWNHPNKDPWLMAIQVQNGFDPNVRLDLKNEALILWRGRVSNMPLSKESPANWPRRNQVNNSTLYRKPKLKPGATIQFIKPEGCKFLYWPLNKQSAQDARLKPWPLTMKPLPPPLFRRGKELLG